MFPEPVIPAIGAELVRASEEWERSPAEIMTELFPYVFEASRRMSTRAISRWLEGAHGIKISQPTISRALRNHEKYWEHFAELIEPHARCVENAVRPAMSSFMTDQRVFDWALEQPLELGGDSPEEISAEMDAVMASANFLRDHWFCLSPTTRAYMNRYFVGDEGEAEKSEKPEGDK